MIEDDGKLQEDSELISLAKKGDVDAFGVLYERYVELIFRYIRSRVAEDQIAEDLTEVVFLRSFEALNRYREKGYPFSSYLYQIARNLLVDHYRRQRDEVSLEAAQHIEAPSMSMDEEVIIRERIAELQTAISHLREDYQEVIRLRVLLDLPSDTVAAWMERSEGAVRVLLHRALKSLKKQVLRNEA
jgi:RNA polymerase sigma-70 factor (ECF subfamily)